jgi:Glycosyltransferase family 87
MIPFSGNRRRYPEGGASARVFVLVAVWVGAAALLVVEGPRFVDSLRPEPQQGVDFFQDWSSARNWVDGLPIYTDMVIAAARYLQRMPGPDENIAIAKNSHPPSSVLLTIPFAWFDYPNATLVWNVLSLVSLGVAGWLIARQLGLRLAARWLVPAIALLLTCNPLRHQVHMGQINGMLLLLLIATWVAERSGRACLAGGLLGTATVIKLTPGLFLLYYALLRRWSVVTAGLVTAVGMSAITALVLGADSYRAFAFDVLPQSQTYTPLRMNASLAGFWAKWFFGGAISHLAPQRIPPLLESLALARLGFLLTSAVLLTVWGRRVLSAGTREQHDRTMGLTFTAMLLLSPVTWDYSFLLLALPILQLYGTRAVARDVLLLLVACLWVSPGVFWALIAPNNHLLSLAAVSVQCFALLGLFVMGCRHARVVSQ